MIEEIITDFLVVAASALAYYGVGYFIMWAGSDFGDAIQWQK